MRMRLPARLLVSVVAILLSSHGPKAHGALGDWLKRGKDKVREAAGAAADAVTGKASEACDTALGAARDGVDKATAAAKRAQEMAAPLQQTLSEVPDMIRGLRDPAETSYDFSKTMLLTVIKTSPGAARRVFFFGGTLDEVRTEIVVPLLGHLRTLRENKDNPEVIAEVLGRLTIYCIETMFKMNIVFQEQIRGGIKAVLFSSGKSDNPQEGPAHLLTILRQEVLSHIWAAISTPGLTWRERIQRIQDTETPLMVAINRASEQLGWTDLEAEIAIWKAENYSVEIGQPSSPTAAQLEGPTGDKNRP